MSNDESLEQNQEEKVSYPDTVFKELTHAEALQFGLQASETEFQYTTRADLVLKVPPGISLEGTMFDFFRAVNIVEFKSQDDRFNLRQYIKNQLRTDLEFLQNDEASFDDILNVFILSRLPQRFLTVAKKRGLSFEVDTERPWLWRGQVGFHDIVLVICRDLPLERRYYQWLIFAPADSQKWYNFAVAATKQGHQDLVKLLERLRPKEYTAMLTQEKLNELIEQGLFDQLEKSKSYKRDKVEAVQIALNAIVEILTRLEPDPETVEQVLQNLSPEQRQIILKFVAERNKEQ